MVAGVLLMIGWRGEDMRQYKWVTIILTGILVTSIIMVGYHVWASNRNQAGYDVDSDYISKKEVSQTPSNPDAGTEIKNESDETTDNTRDKAIENTQETIRDKEGKDEQSAESEPHKGTDPIDVKQENEDNKPSGEETVQVPDRESTDQSESTDGVEPSTPDDVKKSEDDFTGHEWVDETINENRDDIADADLDAGLSIGDKIDDDILLGYLEDGLTEEERADLKEYLEVVLTPEEMSKLDALFNKYNYMFQ